MPMIPPKKPTPVRDARKEQLMLAKQERDMRMAEKAAKKAATKPPPPPMPDRPMPRPPQKPMSGGRAPPPTDFDPLQNPTSGGPPPMPDRPMPRPPQKPMSGGRAPPPTDFDPLQNPTSGGPPPKDFKPFNLGNDTPTPVQNVIQPPGMKRGGSVNSASRRGDGIAQRGKTKGRYL